MGIPWTEAVGEVGVPGLWEFHGQRLLAISEIGYHVINVSLNKATRLFLEHKIPYIVGNYFCQQWHHHKTLQRKSS